LQKNGQSRVTACTPNISSDHYVVEEAGRSQQVVYGKIVKARPVEVAAHNDGNGTLVGTASGATVGSAIGDSTRANVLGALGTQTGIEYIVNLDNGKTISIVQGAKPPLQVGQRVMLMTGGNSKDRLVAA
jgi:outer membrane lipoprotein SlyB